jgi:hypothetical protein
MMLPLDKIQADGPEKIALTGYRKEENGGGADAARSEVPKKC